MTLMLTWDNHNRLLQADQSIAYDDGDTGREDGQQTVVEWRFGTSPTGPWGAPTTDIVTAPQIATYTPAADGWVQITCYTTRDGVVSWQAHVGVVRVDGSGDLLVPATRITESGDRRITESGDARITE